MKLRNILLAACAAFAVSPIFAETRSLPVVEVLGQQYYVYETRKGDSLFGIARQFGWDDAELQRVNPSAVAPFKKGTKLYYPVQQDKKVENPVKTAPETLERSPLKHLVKKGETVYSISKLYGIPVETIYRLNPSSKKGIRYGEELVLQTVKEVFTDVNDGGGNFYTVKYGDTLYKVAQNFGVSVEAILNANPGVSEKNFLADSVIRIPARGTGLETTSKVVEEKTLSGFETHRVEKNDTWSSIAEKNGVTESSLREANPDTKNLKNNQVISVPVIETTRKEVSVVETDPRELTSDGLQDIYEDVHRIADTAKENVVRVDLVLDAPSSKKDLEFTRGFLTAVDALRSRNIHIDLHVIDGSRSEMSVIDSIKALSPSVIISTAEKNVPDYLVKYSTENHVPLVNTFDVKSEAYADNAYVVQLLTPSQYFNDAIAEYAKDRFDGYRLIMVGPKDDGDSLGEALRETWEPGMVTLTTADNIENLTFSDGKNYLVYGYPVKRQEVSELLGKVAKIKENNIMANVNVLGRPNWIVFDESLSEPFHQADVIIPSRFYFDRDNSDAKAFTARYRSLFDRTPAKSFPMYAAFGYDTALYFIGSLAATGGDMNSLPASSGTVQSDFLLSRPSNWSGLMNTLVYGVRFTPYDTVEKVIVK